MLRVCIATFAACCLLAAPARAARELHWVSYPALSPDAATVYFTAWGDIWAMPADGSAMARRLTDNVAYDGRPLPSPDGSQIAFVSDRFGSYDIYIMSAEGGPATRLTWLSSVDYLYDWKPDGSAILAYTMIQDQWAQVIYEIPLDGSQPRRITGPDHDDNVWPSYLGDAGHLIYARGPADWARKDYRGSGNYDLWTFDVAAGAHAQVTQFDGNDMWPQPSPDGSTVYFTADRDGTDNIWALDLASGTERQLTQFTEDGPRWPRISADGSTLAFTVFGDLYTLGTAEGSQPRLVPVRFDADPKHELQLTMDQHGAVSEYALSPNGKYFALVVMGDVYVLKNAEAYPPDAKPDQDLSRSFQVVDTDGREMQLTWSPESNRLAYISDRDGQFEVYIQDLATSEEQRLTNSSADEWWPQFAPQGDRIAYYCGNRCISVYDFKTNAESKVVSGQVRHGPWVLGYEWSPDGRWLTYGQATLDYLSDVFIVNVEDPQPINVSASPDWDSDGTFSRDGRWLAYTHQREDGAEVMLLELSPKEKKYDTDVLFPDDKPKPKEEPAAAPAAPTGDKPAEGAAPAEPAPPAKPEVEPIKIDLTRIHLRAQPVTQMQGNAYGPRFDPSSKFILFTSEHEGHGEFWTVTVDGQGYAQLGSADGMGAPQFSPDGSRLYMQAGGQIIFVALNGAAPAGSGGAVPAVSRVNYNQYSIWNQMLAEGWRHLRDGFYDEKMHNVDWEAVLKRYRPRVQEVGTPDEFSQLMREMLGELNASHLAFYGSPSTAEAPPQQTADFGVQLDEAHEGEGWLVSKIVTGGPADQPGSRLFPGDVILSVNAEPVDARTNYGRLMVDLGGIPTTLVVRSGAEAIAAERAQEAAAGAQEPQVAAAKPAAEDKAAEQTDAAGVSQEGLPAGQRRVVISPAAAGQLGQLRYEQWVDDNRAEVYAATGGEIGYQHIQGMNQPSLEKFRRELFTESRGKKALIIDVRFNGGGNTHEQLIELLDRRAFAIGQLRGSEPVVHPAARWEGPIVVLINAHSFSDAEIFPHIMKKLGLATIIGEPTGGNVIGTYDFPLLDGSGFRLPTFGWQLLDDARTVMELHGAQPDIYVHIDPMALAEGRDNQLEAAVEFLRGKISP